MKIYIKDHKTIAQRGERETRTRKGKTRRKGKVRVEERTAREVGLEEEEEEEEVGPGGGRGGGGLGGALGGGDSVFVQLQGAPMRHRSGGTEAQSECSSEAAVLSSV